jgi:phage shock protein A
LSRSRRRWKWPGLRHPSSARRSQHEQAVVAEKEAFITELKELIEKLDGQVGHYRQAKFGAKSEKLDPAQLELALEDLETAIAETQAQIAMAKHSKHMPLNRQAVAMARLGVPI